MVTLRDDYRLPVSVVPVDAHGHPAAVENPTWTLSNPNAATLQVAVDGLSVIVTPTGLLGPVQLVVKADAKIGPEVKILTGTLDIEVVGGEAVSMGVAAGIPEPIPGPPPPA